MTYQSGSAISYYILDITDAERKAAQLRSIYDGIRQDAANLSTPTINNNPVSSVNSDTVAKVNSYNTALKQTAPITSEADKATINLINSTIALGNAQGLTADEINAQLAAMSRAALLTGDYAAANLLLDVAVGETIPVIVEQGVAIAATGEHAKDFGDKFQSGLINKLTNFIGPVAAITATLGLFKGALDETEEGFKLNASLDESARSINLMLGEFRNVPNVMADAANFADKYKLTQKEVNEALNDAVPVLRRSTQGVETILGVFDRLAVSKPGKTFNDAARAIGELQTGQLTSIEKIFNVPAEKAQIMKQQIEAGADAVAVVNDYLNKTGVTLAVLDERTQGVAGKTRELAVEAEKYQRALGGDFGGIGLLLLNAKIDATRKSTQALSGDTQTMSSNFGTILGAVSPATQAIVDLGSGSDTLITKFNAFTGAALPSFTIETQKSIDALKEFFGVVQTPIIGTSVDRTKDDFIAAKEAINQANKALVDDIEKKGTDAIATDRLNKLQKLLGDLGPQVAGGLVSAAQGAELLRSAYGLTAAQAERLISDQVQLAQTTQNTAVLLANQEANTRKLATIGVGAPGITSGLSNTVESVVQLQQTNSDLLKAQQDAILAHGTATEKVKVQQDRLNAAISEYGKQSPQAISASNNLITAQDQSASSTKSLLDAQISYAEATKDTVTARRLLNEELKNAAGDTQAELAIKTRIANLDKQKTGTAGGKGLTGLDRSEIKLAGDLQQQLDEVNRRLESGHLTQLQRNQLLIDQAKLQEQINSAVQKEADLQNTIALDQVHNAQKTNEENAELIGLRRAENDSRFSAAQQIAIRLREQEILLEQQKRSNDITKEGAELQQTLTKTGVGASSVPPGATIAPPGVSQVPPIGSGLPVTASGVPQVALTNESKPVINLTINIDKDGRAVVTPADTGVTLRLIGNAFGAQVASGGLP